MNKTLLVGLGGFVGSILRYGLALGVHRWKGGSTFPLETLVINVTGCLVFGVLVGWSESRGAFSDPMRVLLFSGLLGGFTTFSAFGFETFRLLRDGQWFAAMISSALQLVLGIGAVWAGRALVFRGA